MKKEEAEKILTDLTKSNLGSYDKQDITDFGHDIEEITEFVEMMDEGIIIEDDFIFENCEMLVYTSDSDERDITAFIIMCEENVVAYGYVGD